MTVAATATLRIPCGDATNAKAVHAAVAADDDEFAASTLDGTTVVGAFRGENVASLLRAVDDWLACAAVAEDVMNKPPIGRQNA